MTTTLYEGTKRVHAKPMNRGEYNVYRGWEVPSSGTGGKVGLVFWLTGGYSRKPRDCIKSIGSLALLDRLHGGHKSCRLVRWFVPPRASGLMWSRW